MCSFSLRIPEDTVIFLRACRSTSTALHFSTSLVLNFHFPPIFLSQPFLLSSVPLFFSFLYETTNRSFCHLASYSVNASIDSPQTYKILEKLRKYLEENSYLVTYKFSHFWINFLNKKYNVLTHTHDFHKIYNHIIYRLYNILTIYFYMFSY